MDKDAIRFERDDAKAAANLRKHGVDFDEAESVLRNDLTHEFPDLDHSIKEERWIAIGHSSTGKLLVISYTDRPNSIRIISARKATKREIREYES